MRSRALNTAAQRCPMELVRADAFEHLRALAAQSARFDAIVLDPPPLARSAKDKENALRAYRDLNRQGFKLLAPGGVLISSCCSHAVSAADFAEAVARGAREAGADPFILDTPPQPPDHPVHLHTPETGYIKTVVVGV